MNLPVSQAGERRPEWEEEKELGLFHALQEGSIDRERRHLEAEERERSHDFHRRPAILRSLQRNQKGRR